MKKNAHLLLFVIILSGCHMQNLVYNSPYKNCAEISSPLDTIKKLLLSEGDIKANSIEITESSIKFKNYKTLNYSDIKDVKIAEKNSFTGKKYYVRLFLTLGYHNKTEFMYSYDEKLAIETASIFECLINKNKQTYFNKSK